MGEKMTLIKALWNHVRIPGESLGDFTKATKTLTDADRAWYTERFKVEYGIEIVAAP